jgi:ABC-type branched-subunit amino acid transport system ATPase component
MTLVCEHVSVTIGGTPILSDISFAAAPGNIVGLIGPNGCGKTTLLNVLSGLQEAQGNVRLGTEMLSENARYRLARMGVFRSFQEGRLFENHTVEQNIALAFRPPPDERLSAALFPFAPDDPSERERSIATTAALRAVGIEGYRNSAAVELSYGTRKRTILGQACAAAPTLCLLDEPLAGVDPNTRESLIELLSGLRKSDRIVVIVEHDLHAISQIADRVLLLDRGKLCADGSVQEVLESQMFLDAYLKRRG